MHSVLMNSVRGQRKSPGAFRDEQNWIGSEGCTMQQAKFVPPAPEGLSDHLRDFQAYMAGTDVDVLIQTAIVHAQFEILHPFKDGNGRIGRLLIPLFLFQKSAFTRPMFYLSEYLEAHRDEYYTRLRQITESGDWTGWIVFFLDAVRQQALDNADRVKGILSLYDEMKVEVQAVTHSQYTPAILDALFDRPIFRAANFASRSNVPSATAKKALRQLRDASVLQTVQESRGSQSAVLAFPRLFNLAEGREVM